ncbi:MAG: hypothetical protein ACERKV_04480 [Clostridiaceae bacterium]
METKKLARGSIFTSLSIILIYLSKIIPLNKIYLLGIASAIIPICIITIGVKPSILVYVSTSVLSSIILGFTGVVLSYIIFFGSYGFIKYYVERIRKLPIEIVLKLIFFDSCFYVIYKFFDIFLNSMPKINLPLNAVVIMLQVIFIVFDYALTLFINWYRKKITLDTNF